MVLVTTCNPKELKVENEDYSGVSERIVIMNGVSFGYLIDTATGECTKAVVSDDVENQYGYYKMQPFDIVDDIDHEHEDHA